MSERPKITKEIIAEAAEKLTANISAHVTAEEIAENYHRGIGGYDLARAIDGDYGDRSFSADDVETLDGMWWEVDKILRVKESEWVKTEKIIPQLNNGTRVTVLNGIRNTEGVIDHVDMHGAARYCVKEDGCTKKGTFLLVKFEDAKRKEG